MNYTDYTDCASKQVSKFRLESLAQLVFFFMCVCLFYGGTLASISAQSNDNGVSKSKNLSSKDSEPPQFDYQQYYEEFVLKDRFEGVFYPELEQNVNDIKPNVGGDVFYDFNIPPETMKKTDDEIDRLLYKALTSFRSQKGIEYFSHRRQAYRIFIEDSYMVDSTKTRKETPDLVLSDNAPIPAKTTQYIYQEDSSFGNGVRRIDISYDKNAHEFYMQITNIDNIKYKGLITIAKPESFLVSLIVKRTKDKVQTYGVTAVHSNSFSAIKKRISISIVYRIFALAKWYEAQSLKVFAE